VSQFLIIRTEAEADLTEGFNWYEERRSGLGFEFLARVGFVLTRIEVNPLRYAGAYRNVRQALIRKFPYKILYVADDERIEIIGVVHVKRSPQFWQKRVSQ
jgi:plasmid stabilization system protein ParE